MRLNHLRLLVLACFAYISSFAQNKSTSVLSEGTFYKIAVEQNGMYKLDLAFLESLPENEQLNPNDISLFGNRGGMLPELIATSRIDDLEEIPMLFVGNSDNVMTSDEYFLFYAEGPELLTNDGTTFTLKNNVYEEKNYYFLSTTSPRQKSIVDVAYSNPSATVTTYDDYQKHDNDLVNLLGKNFGTQGTGKRWYGEEFSGDRNQQFIQYFDDENIVDGSEIEFRVEMAGRSNVSSNFTLTVNETTKSQSISSVSIFEQYVSYARHRRLDMNHVFNAAEGLNTIVIDVRAFSEIYFSWLDFISMKSIKHLRYSNDGYNFRKLGSGIAAYEIQSSPATAEVWIVDNPHEVIRPTQSGIGALAFNAPLGAEMIVFDRNNITQTPELISKISPQNVHSITDAEYVILYHGDFEEPALRLAEHRASFDGLVVYAINIEHVFNEFAGGSKDPIAIRDFARMLFKRSGTFNYLCLMGDATYDYRGINAELPMNNFIPCYQTDQSLSPISGFPTDDFYALLSDSDGGNLQGALDIAVGRLPVGSVQEANTVVNKLINYDTDTDFNGEWKNNFILVADDEDGNGHLRQTESLATTIAQDRPEFNLRKVYFDAFPQRSTTGDDRYPDAKQKFNDYMFQGALLVNYFGHGGPNGWAQERVLEIQDILAWSNAKRLPFFITATCTFTGYDDAAEKSGGELTLLNPNGGSIGLVSTTRAVGISSNERLVKSLFEFMYEKEDNKYLRMGEILRLGKNNHRSDTLGENARKFALIGDPAFRLSIPEYSAVLTTFQENPAQGVADTIRALDEVSFSGQVLGYNGELVEDYNGNLEITVMDKAQTNRTLANDPKSFEVPYKSYNAVIFKGNAPVTNGKFEVRFRVPKDIDYEYGNGRISLYASNDSDDKEASGYFENFIIGGTSDQIVNDDSPPTIDLVLNNNFFNSGDVVGPDPVLIASVGDDLGINISNTSIGHEMIAILDGDLPNQIILNDYYEALPNSFTEGVITYPFNNLADGKHTLTVRVWDVANNASEATVEFIVEKGEINILKNVQVWPNPSRGDVEFSFTHQLSFAPVNVFIQFYDNFGRAVSELTTSVTTGGNAIENIEWNRVGYHGSELPAGLYYYRINASASSANGETENATSSGGKIILLD